MKMKKILPIIFLLFIFTIPAIAGQYKVVRVVDGDTIDIIYKGKKERIRCNRAIIFQKKWEFSKFCVTVQFSDLLLHLAEVEARP